MPNSQPLIDISHITVKYDRTIALQDASLTIRQNDFIAVIGPNGGGKTTLVKALLGLVPYQQGHITYYDPQGQPTHSLPIGYLPQYTAFDFRFPITVQEVVHTGLLAGKPLFAKPSQSDKQQVDDILHQLQLHHLARRPISEISGGQRQRVLMARALVSQPRLLVLDEPATYIDHHSQHQLITLLHAINTHCAIILVSHDITTIQHTVKTIVHVNKTLTIEN